MEIREFPLFLFRLKNREKGRRTHGREKQNYQAFKAWKRERESSAPLLGSDHLAGRQIPARLTFSSKNEEKKKKKKKDKDISPGQGLVFRIRHYHSVFLSFSYNPRPVFVLHVFSLLSLSLSLLSTWILGSRSFPPGGQTE